MPAGAASLLRRNELSPMMLTGSYVHAMFFSPAESAF